MQRTVGGGADDAKGEEGCLGCLGCIFAIEVDGLTVHCVGTGAATILTISSLVIHRAWSVASLDQQLSTEWRWQTVLARYLGKRLRRDVGLDNCGICSWLELPYT